MYTLIIKDGLLWLGDTKRNENILGTIQSDLFSRKNNFVYVENLIEHYGENRILIVSSTTDKILAIDDI